MAIKITDLGQATIPLAGTEVLELVQDDQSRQVTADDLASAASGLNATFVTISANAFLPNERILTAGTGINIVDGGAGLAVTVSVLTSVLQPEQLFEAGTVVVNTLAQGDVTIRADVVGTTPPAPADNFVSILDFYNITEVNRIGRVGFNGIGGNLDIFNEVHGGDVILAGEDSTGVVIIGLQIDPDAITTLRGDTEIELRYGGTVGGVQISTPDADHPFRLVPLLAGVPVADFFDYNTDRDDWEIRGDIVFSDNASSNRTATFDTDVVINGADRFIQAPLSIGNASNHGSTGSGDIYFVSDTGANRGLFLGRQFFAQNLTDKGASQFGAVFDTDTSMITDPGLYNLRFDNATPASVTEISIDDTGIGGHDFGAFWGAELVSGDKLFIKQVDDDTRWIVFTLTGVPVDQTGFWTMPVSVDSSGVLPVDTEEINVEVILASLGGAGLIDGTIEGQIPSWDVANSDYRPAFGVLAEAAAGPPVAGTGYLSFNTTGTVAERQPQMWLPAVATISVMYTVEHQTNDSGFYLRTRGNVNPARHTWGSYASLVDVDMFEITEDLEFNMLAASLFYIGEKSAAGADKTAFGQWWVRDDVPNVPMFTDDLGNDFVLTAGAIAISGTPVNNQLAVWTGAATLEGEAGLTFDSATNFFRIHDTIGTSGIQIDHNGSDSVLSNFGASPGAINAASRLVTSASTTVRSGFNVQEGVAPSSPIDGDVWVTAAGGYFARLNGVSVDLTAGSAPIILLDNEQIQFGTSTDVTMDWDGTDFEVEGLASGQVWNWRDSVDMFWYGADNIDFMSFNVDSVANQAFWNTNNINSLAFQDGIAIRIFNSGNVDHVQILHNSTEGQISTGSGDGDLALIREGTQRSLVCVDRIPAGAVSSATVEDSFGTDQQVGFALMPIIEDNPAGLTLGSQHAGQTILMDDDTAFTVTVPASSDVDFPVGAITTLINANTAAVDMTISDNATGTLFYLDGSSVTDIVGTALVGPGGVANIWRRSTTEWFLWGTGITP